MVDRQEDLSQEEDVAERRRAQMLTTAILARDNVPDWRSLSDILIKIFTRACTRANVTIL